MSETRPATRNTSSGSPSRPAAHHPASPGIIVIDRDEKLESITAQAAQILGLTPPVAAGGSASILPASLQTLAREILRSGAASDDLEIEISNSGGGKRMLAVAGVPIQRGKEVCGVVLAVGEAGRVHEIRETLWRLDRLANVGTLSAGMAHEIKNALVAGKTFIDLLLEKNRDAELAEVVRRELGRIDAMVTRILKFAGPDRPSVRPLSVNEILDHSLRLVQPLREDKLISLHRSLQAEPDVVRGDEYQLQQAFVNLLLNALEATGPDGTLTVVTETVTTGAQSTPRSAGSPQIRITIADNGEGIAPEHLDRLFEPFFTTKAEGTGLGLPITRRIIEDHQGAVTVESRPKNGTTFRITLPVHDPAAAAS